MYLRVLVNNDTFLDQPFLGEPGWSCYIEDGDAKILFDTGFTDIVLKNAAGMNIDLGKLSHIIFSHGHNDHTGGFPHIAKAFDLSNTELVCHPSAFVPKYDESGEIGMEAAWVDETKKLKKITLSEEPLEITERLIFLGSIPRTNDFENKTPVGWLEPRAHEAGAKPSTDPDAEHEYDFMKDDTALAYKSDKGIFVITGCSHSGICNIVEYAKKVCGDDRVVGVIGGFHMLHRDERLIKTIKYFQELGAEKLYPCHCCTFFPRAEMYKLLPVYDVGVGLELEL